MPKWLQIQHIPVIFDRTLSLVDYNRPIVFLFAASRSFESLLRMSEYFGNISSLMCCVLGALHLVCLEYCCTFELLPEYSSFVRSSKGSWRVFSGSFVRTLSEVWPGWALTRSQISIALFTVRDYCFKSSGVYWAGIVHVEWISGRTFNHTCVCCIPLQFWNAWF